MTIDAQPVDTEHWKLEGARLAGAWRLSADDPRFGGLSGLAIDRGSLLAITDSGSVVRFPVPSAARQRLAGRITDLPAGPGPPTLKSARDSEAIAADGKGDWWVAFEVHHWLWFYRGSFDLGYWAVDLEQQGLAVNRGIEGLVRLGDGRLLAFPEDGDRAIAISLQPRLVRSDPLLGAGGQIADAALLPDGRPVVLRRLFGTDGVSSRIDLVRWMGKGWAADPMLTFSTRSLANFEGATAALLPDGRTRLWLVSDDDFRASGRTLLVALDLPPARAGGETR